MSHSNIATEKHQDSFCHPGRVDSSGQAVPTGSRIFSPLLLLISVLVQYCLQRGPLPAVGNRSGFFFWCLFTGVPAISLLSELSCRRSPPGLIKGECPNGRGGKGGKLGSIPWKQGC